MSWIVTLPCTRAEAEALTDDVTAFALLDQPPSIVTSEVDEDRGEWRLDAYFADEPDAATLATLIALVPSAAGTAPRPEPLPDADWLTLSQTAIAPVRAGRFFVHTASNADTIPPGTVAFRIEASQAFGTGGHETTAGCLAMLDRVARTGARFDRIADIGTGTGLLAFAAMHLWPRATATASDIDPVSIAVTLENAAINGVRTGMEAGALATAVAPGTDHPLIAARAPYDLVIANILAGPLITLAPDIAAVTEDGGTLILAGLLDRQRAAVARAYRAQGFRLAETRGNGDWPTLRLVKRRRFGWRRPERSFHRADPADASFGAW